MIPLMIIVAQIITRKPRRTEKTFDLDCSFASALTGNTMISPIQMITPTAMTLVITCTLRMIVAIYSRNCEFSLVTERFHELSELTPLSGLQFLNSCIASTQLYTHLLSPAAYTDDRQSRIHRKMREKNF